MSKDGIKTTLSLTIICVMAALLLGIVNSVTAPVIATRAEADRAEKRQEVMAEADSFEPIENIENYDKQVWFRQDISLCQEAKRSVMFLTSSTTVDLADQWLLQ